MQIVLRQRFPLGRFHATPWRVNPFDDPFGEWPPSPWRLLRALVARWYQWRRESGGDSDHELDRLITALCASSYRFYLPVHARRGTPLRQYQPVEFGWNPKTTKKAGAREYTTSLVQDNYWCTPTDAEGDVWWFIEGDTWTPDLIDCFDECLARVTYFGRAEAFTTIWRTSEAPPVPNCDLASNPSPRSVRVIVPDTSAMRVDVERITDDPLIAGRTIPPGARLMYAIIPSRPPAREMQITLPLHSAATHLIQLAIGWNVLPEAHAIVRLTSRFRSAVLRELYRIKSNGRTNSWSYLKPDLREAVGWMTGKDAQGQPLQGHCHAEFFAWFENRLPTRLLVWRDSQPFDSDEQQAIFAAASREISWAASGPDAADWKVRLVPLDSAVPAPPGFADEPVTTWQSMTPYVPPRHHLRAGKLRASESPPLQIKRELSERGFSKVDLIQIQEIADPAWVAVHVPHRDREGRRSLGDKRGYFFKIDFSGPVRGPIRLGHSASFGLGLFAPL